jgi:hypothetical protein
MCRGGRWTPTARAIERIDGQVSRGGAQVRGKVVAGIEAARHPGEELLARDERSLRRNRAELGDRVAVDCDGQPLAGFDAAQQRCSLVSQCALRNLRSHRATG